MISKLLYLIENLNLSNLNLLVEMYHADSVFHHPLKSVKGAAAIKRQWKLTLKCCPNTKIKILENCEIDSGTYFLKWSHEFDYRNKRKNYEGTSLILLDENQLIVEQTDQFNIMDLIEVKI